MRRAKVCIGKRLTIHSIIILTLEKVYADNSTHSCSMCMNA